MRTLTRAVTVATLAAILFAAASPATARSWKTTPYTRALQYLEIFDQRADNELVQIFWVAPELIKAEPKNKMAREALRKYIVIGTAHANISTLGEFTLLDSKEVVLRIEGGGKRRPLDPDSIAPAAAGMVTVMQRVFTQAIGKLGQGTHWLTFEGAGIDSCGPGVFWVDFAGEQYDYRTPIPGCP